MKFFILLLLTILGTNTAKANDFEDFNQFNQFNQVIQFNTNLFSNNKNVFSSDNTRVICTIEHGTSICTDTNFNPYTGLV
ncbi:MAG: hypothetical protein IKW39_06280, partial [Alphaproteobacteria bacterium]|nr:hypothetical protein [Alphaproteobacteria bacterium]